MSYCSVPVPPINATKDPNYTFDFTPEQIAQYGQSQTHPSIIYIPGGWNGHEYWLATTPYPFAMDVFENPCIYYGDADAEGNPPVLFTPISGVASGDYIMVDNPVVKVPSNDNINSDPDLYFDATAQIMYLYSRYNNVTPKRGYIQKSLTGQAWTKRDNSIFMDMDPQPSLLKVGNEVFIYGLDGASFRLYYPDAGYLNQQARSKIDIWKGSINDISSFQRYGSIYIKGKRAANPYHADFFKDDATGKYYMIFCGPNHELPREPGTAPMYVYLAESEDGLNFYTFAKPLLGKTSKASNYYRPTACIRQSDRTLIVYWSTTGGIIKTADQYPRGASDIPVDQRTIGLSFGNFDVILNQLKENIVTDKLD